MENGLVIQNGVVPSMTSRMVPPPMATAMPQTYPPNQSKFFAAACLIPEMAKANVPRNSMTCCMEISQRDVSIVVLYYLFTTLMGVPSRNALTLLTAVLISRCLASRLAQAI